LAKLSDCTVNDIGRALGGTIQSPGSIVGLLDSSLIALQRALNALI
jgi:hypothetical protein